MAASWERVVGSVERLLPPGLADYETEVVAVAAVSTLLAFVGETHVRVGFEML